MLRITQQSSAAAARRYYAGADYYTEGRETRGLWGGKAARLLGLEGAVSPRDFDMLTENRDPRDGSPLTARKKAERTVGYDFTFSVPKSVSLYHAVTQDGRVVDAFRESARETMEEIEREMKARVRRGGENAERTTGSMAWAEFLHFTGRPVDGVPDPQMHIHVFAFNATYDAAEGRFKAGQFRDLKRDGPYWQAAFRVRLANRLQGMGLALDVRKGDFEVAGVGKETIDKFSRRTAVIDAEARAEEEVLRKERDDPDLRLTPAQRAALGGITREAKGTALTWEELRREWLSRLAPGELDTLLRASAGRGHPALDRGAEMAAAFAVGHHFERASVVDHKRLLAETLSAGLGKVTVDGARRALAAQGLIVREREGRLLATAPHVLAEEERMLAFAREGRGSRKALYPEEPPAGSAALNEGQRRAVGHVLTSRDRVVLIRGAAGTGKTTLMREAVAAIRAKGKAVVVLAPSAAASRGVLRSEGFDGADTVAMFLRSAGLQERARGGFLWVDEAGLLGSRDTARLFEAAGRLDARVVLSGDRAQHASPARGSPLRLLEELAGLKPAAVTEIVRQKRADYRHAVRLLSEGRAAEGLGELSRLGWVKEAPAADRYRLLAEAYVEALQGKGAGGRPATALVVSPTHAEAERITAEIRRLLRERERLGEERTVRVWVPLHLTEAERGREGSYKEGDMIQFHKHAKGYKSGDRLVAGAAPLPLAHAARFQAYRPAEIVLAAGDRVRVTANGKSKDGRRLNNGDLFTVAGLTRTGDVELTNGAVIARDFGHVAHGHVVTSHNAQGRTVDTVLVGQSAASLPASSREQLYVSISRGRAKALVFTDSAESLREAARRSDDRLLATELVRPAGRAWRVRAMRLLTFRRREEALAQHRQLAAARAGREREGREVSHGR